MRYYQPQKQYQYFCGVDLHTKTMYLCVQDEAGRIQLHKNIRAQPGAFLEAVKPYRDSVVVACECVFCWFGPVPVRCCRISAGPKASSLC